ncbi:polysaccharide biosynthesis/export family protein [Burkholderia sp. JKS000303]|uniref:polysaccharide biosynthesis/export family protein n=1 Tax=Burkholderia sp. JKS000303 TaxID=1938747 RepID=UPI000C008385|nr:polysaccharide biosynthesis/export family protein [Burkholderia sp. JKS000303]PFH19517.1 polysaccharide export outer membrane protein [Burkholderia sp. JKS000303]
MSRCATVWLACVVLAGCAYAPGMRMTAPAGAGMPQVAYVDTDSNGAQADRHAPIVELDLGRVRQMRAQAAQGALDVSRSLAGTAPPYAIGPGDVLRIVVWNHPELAAAQGPQQQGATRDADPVAGFVVDQDGALSFPYAGRIEVSGLRPEQARERVAAALSRYFRDPQVTLGIASFRSRQVFVEGEVRNPGVLSLNDVPTTLYDAIGRAGGLNDSADRSRIELIRGGASYTLDLTQQAAGHGGAARIALKPGDLLRVASRNDSFVYVIGEVGKPVAATPDRNGRITLADALVQAGGLNPGSADAAQMYVIRGSLDEQPQVFHLDGTSPVSMLAAKEFDLQPKDVVYVDANNLVRASRVLNLLLPAINAGMTAGLITK